MEQNTFIFVGTAPRKQSIHVKGIMKKKLHQIGVCTSVATKICTTFLGTEHNGLSTFGLVDEEDGKMFDSIYGEIKRSLSNAFIM